MKRLLICFLLVLAGISPRIAGSEVIDRIIAIVNDDIVTLAELEKHVQIEKHGRFVTVNEYFRNLQLRERIDAFVDNLLIKQQAKKLKIDVSRKEVDNIVNNIKKQYLVNEEELKEQLKKDNISYSDFLDGLKTSTLRGKVLSQVISPEVLVTDGMLRDYYNKHIDEYREEEYRLKQIFISNKVPDPLKKAFDAHTLLKEGRSFESVAKEFSDDPSGPEGGDIGAVKSEELIPELRDAVRNLAPGAYTNIVRTPYGALILKLVETKKGSTIGFEVVKDKVHERIIREETDKRYRDFVTKLRKGSYIEVKI
jgi:peptidyl-prolyl cis-trans isomerase SurA